MKKKLLLLSLVVISCVCVAFGLTGCKHSHTLVKTDEIAATCTTDGQEAYWTCSDSSCGKMFSDAEGTTEITAPIVIPATGHSYAATFEWTAATEGGYTAAATLTCSACNDTQTVTATVTSETTAATCTADGSIVYTATATYDGETYTDTKTVTLAKTEHTYSEIWSSDGTSHWHACTACGAATDVDEHTFVKNSEGKYVCSVCGKEVSSYIDSTSTTALATGDNYLLIDDYYTYYTVTFAATADGTYTFAIATDSNAQVNITDIYGNSNKIGVTGYGDDVYSVSLDMDETYSYTISITAAEGADDISDYLFCLNISYVEKDVANIGEEANPYAITEVSSIADTLSGTVAANSSYYFTVATESDTYVQLRYSGSLAFYMGDTQITFTEAYGWVYTASGSSISTVNQYLFISTSTATTFKIVNTSNEEATFSFQYVTYSGVVTSGDNTLTYSSDVFGTGISVTLYVPTSTVYTVALASGSTDGIAISVGDSIVLGSGATADTYSYTNTSSRNAASIALTITYTGTAVETYTIKLTVTSSAYDPDASATYTALTLDTASTATLDYYSDVTTAYFSYTAAAAGDYTLTLTKDGTWGIIWNYSTTVKVNGTIVSGTDEGVYSFTLEAGENKIVISLNASGTLSATLSVDDSEPIDYYEGTALSLDTTYILKAGSTYSFTAPADGDYTFAVGSTSDVWVYNDDIELSDDIYYGATETYTMSAGDTYYIGCWNASADASTITIFEATDYALNASTSGLTIAFTAGDAYTAYVVVGGTYAFTCEDYDGVKVTYTYETAYSNTGYASTTDEIYNGTWYLTLIEGDTLTLNFTYTGSTSLSISYVEPAVAGTAYTATLDSDNNSVQTTLTITETGYYKVTVSGAYVTIYDSGYNYYYSSSRQDSAYILDYRESDEVPVEITAGTVLHIYINYNYTDTNASVLIELDENYSGSSSGDGEGATYTEIELDEETTISGTTVYQITATEDGTLVFTLTSGDMYISLSADSSAYDSNNGTDDEIYGSGDTASITVSKGDVLYVYNYTDWYGNVTESTFTVSYKKAAVDKDGYYNISTIGTESVSDSYITYSTTASSANTNAGTYDGTLDEGVSLDESIRLYTGSSATISITLSVVANSTVTIYYAGKTDITITGSDSSTKTLTATSSSTTVAVETITLTAGVTYTLTCTGGVLSPAAVYAFVVVPTAE